MISKVKLSQQALKYVFAAVLLVIGLDQVLGTNLIKDWPEYISPLAASILPVSAMIIIKVLGIAEIAVAILMATKWTKIAAYVSAVVLAVTAINLLSLGLVDVAARDVLLIVAVLALAWLTEALESNGQTA